MDAFLLAAILGQYPGYIVVSYNSQRAANLRSATRESYYHVLASATDSVRISVYATAKTLVIA